MSAIPIPACGVAGCNLDAPHHHHWCHICGDVDPCRGERCGDLEAVPHALCLEREDREGD